MRLMPMATAGMLEAHLRRGMERGVYRRDLDPAVAGKVMHQASDQHSKPATLLTQKLTDREIGVLQLLAKGMNNREIANQLHLSEGTVRNHVSAILEKLGVSDRTQAAVIAIQHGF